MKLGIDVSTYLEEMEHGAVYKDSSGKEIDPLDSFISNGVTCMRIRLWVYPKSENGEPYLAGNCDLDNFLKLAALAQSKGYSIMLDFHYSDFWADPKKQGVSKTWHYKTPEDLILLTYNYTKETLQTIKAHGIRLEYIQVGNEITNGMLWPYGRLIEQPDKSRTNYGTFIRLLKAGIRACREEMPAASLILHLEKSNDQFTHNEFLDQMQAADVDYDIIGYSYYPYWHGTMADLFANISQAKRYGKRQMIVEIAYAFTGRDYVQTPGVPNNLAVSDDNLASLKEAGFIQTYPFTPEGQKDFIHDFLLQAKAHGTEAVYWWEPLWIPGPGICWTTEDAMRYTGDTPKDTRNEWSNQCLVDYTGSKLPAFDAFSQETLKEQK